MSLKSYEALCFLHPHLNEEELTKNIVKFEDAIKGLGGSVEKTEKQGRRKTSFRVKKIHDGHLTVTTFSLPADKVINLQQFCKLSESMLRYFITCREA